MFQGIWTIDELFEEFNPDINDNLAEVAARRPCDLEEIELLFQKVKIFGTNANTWRKIAPSFPNRTAMSLK